MKKILFIVALLALAFSSAQACEPCGEIKIIPTEALESCSTGESKTVEVLIYNPEYCYSNITDISLSDDANFDLNRSFGDVPCGDASTVSMRGYQYCTVGVTFKPTTTSGDFSTEIQVTDRDTGVHSTTVKGEIKPCCDGSKCDGKVTDLTLQYNGEEVSPLIEVFQGKYKDYADDGKKGKKCHKKDKKKNKIVKVFSGVVAQGETFEFFGQDKKGTLGTKIFILVNGELAAKIHTSCSQPIGPDLVVGDFTVISGHSRNGGLLKSVNCPDEDMAEPVGECTTGNCDGKVTQLTLENLGAAGVVTVTEKKTGNEIFNGFVATGDTFTFNGSDDKGTMGTEIYVAVDGVENVAIHTSCSKPIGPDMIFGDFKVIEGYSRNGGLLGGVECPSDCNATEKVNYLAGLNLVNPTNSSHVYVDNNTLVFNEYYEANEGLAKVALDDSVDAITRLTFDVNQTAGLFMPRLAGDNGTYYTNDIRHTNRYGFMFPAGNVLDELNFTTWGVGFTGVVSNLSLIEVADFNEPSVVEKSCPVQTSEDNDADHNKKHHEKKHHGKKHHGKKHHGKKHHNEKHHGKKHHDKSCHCSCNKR